MPETIFITGASGYIGTQLTKHAIDSGYTVHALSRSDTSDAHLSSFGVIPVRGDFSSHSLLTAEAAKADVVISLADSICGNFGKISMDERFAINNAALIALAKGLEGSGKPLVVTSGSLYAAAEPNGKETDESSKGWPDHPFGVGSEEVAMSFKEKGIRVCIVRLAPWVYGRAGSGVKIFMSSAVTAGEMVYVDDGMKRTTTVHVDDAAKLFLLVAQKGEKGHMYNATSETDVTFKQLAEAMGQAVGVPVRSQSYEDTEAKMGPFFAKFLALENRAANGNARAMGWKIEAKKGILEEIRSGSYVELARELRKEYCLKVNKDRK